jgi:hypothetical protein
MPGKPLDVFRGEVAVALPEGLGPLDDGASEPLREALARHRLPRGIEGDFHVGDLFVEGFAQGCCDVRASRRSPSAGLAGLAFLSLAGYEFSGHPPNGLDQKRPWRTS